MAFINPIIILNVVFPKLCEKGYLKYFFLVQKFFLCNFKFCREKQHYFKLLRR